MLPVMGNVFWVQFCTCTLGFLFLHYRIVALNFRIITELNFSLLETGFGIQQKSPERSGRRSDRLYSCCTKLEDGRNFGKR